MIGNPSNIEPAQSLVLTKDQHAILGELVEIMGSIESMLIESAALVDLAAAQQIRNKTAGNQGRIWIKAIAGRVNDKQVAALLPGAEQEIREVAEDCNDFVHALFEGDYAKGYMQPGYQTTSAKRSKTGKSRSTSDLQSIRNRAATLSVMVDRIVKAVV
jgi:hypothetical protein